MIASAKSIACLLRPTEMVSLLLPLMMTLHQSSLGVGLPIVLVMLLLADFDAAVVVVVVAAW